MTKVHHLFAENLVVSPAAPARPRRRRKPTLASALRQAARAGASVSGATVEDGKVTLTFGEPASSETSNPWLAELDKVTKQ